MNLHSFGVMEGAGLNGRVDGFRGKLAHGDGSTGQGKQPMRAWQHDFVTGPGGDNTGHEQLEWRVKTLFRKLE
jgi:hypothetical protein